MAFMDKIAEVQAAFEKLAKMDPHVEQSVKDLEAVSPEHGSALRDALTKDKMIPEVGNLAAFKSFIKKGLPGVHVRIDAHGVREINKIHSYSHGDNAVIAFGKALKDTAKGGKVFRVGSDKFHAHFPDHEKASAFARAFREKLGEIPAIGGTHPLAFAMGMGPSVGHAEESLKQAKTAKKAAGYKMGQVKSHAHSLMPGFEGHVPVNPDGDLPIPKLDKPVEG